MSRRWCSRSPARPFRRRRIDDDGEAQREALEFALGTVHRAAGGVRVVFTTQLRNHGGVGVHLEAALPLAATALKVEAAQPGHQPVILKGQRRFHSRDGNRQLRAGCVNRGDSRHSDGAAAVVLLQLL